MNNEKWSIPTEYKGYRFRSRLEARWALFFDLAGVEYIFEPQPYCCGPTGGYLPDFMAEGHYVEMKPYYPDKTEQEKALDFCIKTGNDIKILCGDPYGVIAVYSYAFMPWQCISFMNPYVFADDFVRLTKATLEHLDEKGFVYSCIFPAFTLSLQVSPNPEKGFRWVPAGSREPFVDIERGTDPEIIEIWTYYAIESRMHQFWKPRGQ